MYVHKGSNLDQFFYHFPNWGLSWFYLNFVGEHWDCTFKLVATDFQSSYMCAIHDHLSTSFHIMDYSSCIQPGVREDILWGT
jgi:hypothetical protein